MRVPYLLASLALAACAGASAGGASTGGASAGGAGSAAPELPRINPALGINLGEYTRTPQGMYWQDVRVGDGAEARANSRVSVAYRGVLATTGVAIDSSGGLRISLSSDPIIKGWKLGIPGMKVGGARVLVIPPELGYGMREASGVPGGSTLVFRIQLLNVQ